MKTIRVEMYSVVMNGNWALNCWLICMCKDLGLLILFWYIGKGDSNES